MAIAAVVINRFYNRLLPVLKELDEDESIGPLTLAMLIPSSVDNDFRSLVISSAGLDAMRLSQATTLVLLKLREKLGEDALRIDSVSILRVETPAVRKLTESFDLPQLGVPYQANGMPVQALGLDEAILFLARDNQIKAAA